MKAVKLNGAGGVEVLEYADVENPLPGKDQVLIEVAAAGVNFMDIGKRRGMDTGGYKPSILGVEGAGRVIEVGPGNSDFRKGDRVARVFVQSSYADRIVADVNSLVRLPDDIDDQTAAAILMQGLTASHFATNFYPVQPGDVALVHAGAGGLGLILTQIIKLRGGTVISRVSKADKGAVAKAAGADHVIVDADGHFAEAVLRLTEGEGVHVVYDGSGPKTFQGSLDSLRRTGTFCWFGPVLGAPAPIEIMSLPKSIKLGYAVFTDSIYTPELLRKRTNQLFNWLRDGKLKVKIGRTYQLSQTAQAHTDMESRATTGKLLLIP